MSPCRPVVSRASRWSRACSALTMVLTAACGAAPATSSTIAPAVAPGPPEMQARVSTALALAATMPILTASRDGKVVGTQGMDEAIEKICWE